MTNEDLQKRIDKLSKTFYKFVNELTSDLIEIKKFIAETPNTFNDGDFVTLDNQWVSIYKCDGAQKDWICDYCGGGLDGTAYAKFSEGGIRVFSTIRHSTQDEIDFFLESMKRYDRMWDDKRVVSFVH